MRTRRYRRRRRRRTTKRSKITIRKLLGRGISRPYVDKRNRLMLGSGSRKK